MLLATEVTDEDLELLAEDLDVLAIELLITELLATELIATELLEALTLLDEAAPTIP